MLMIDDKNLSFSNMGLFDTEEPWIHPTVTIDSYELIYVTSGEVFLREEETEYHLRRGDMILLDRGREHGGYETSHGHTSFYWLHFYTDRIEAFGLSKRIALPDRAALIFKEIMHQQGANRTLAELALAQFLITQATPAENGSRSAHEIVEYIRIHSHLPLTVGDVARKFGYSADHISRILRGEFGYDTKTAIVKMRLEYVESLLINTDAPIKRIALQCGFEDENKFVKFFKYHKRITPTQFRNRYFYVHMNSK